MSLAQVKGLLHQLGIKAKKGLGQHFLIDETVLVDIVSAAELTKSDIVIEVGPGLGILTNELAKRAGKVIAVELDTKLASLLATMVSPNVTIVNSDILKVTPPQLLEKYVSPSAATINWGYKVVANLPYYITSATLRHLLEAELKPSLMVIMVQQEVGEAIVAEPGRMSLLSVSVQFYAKPSIMAYVSAQNFYPPPKVDSVVLRLDLLPQPAVKVTDIAGFFEVVRCGFSSRRKQLHNSLAQGLQLLPGQVIALLEKIGIDHKRRAETLSLQEWGKVWEVVMLHLGK